MVSSRFKKATRTKTRLRMGIDGPPGSGKSYTALRFAHAFPGAKIAAIEAGEHGGLSLYLGLQPDGVPFDFDILEMSKNFAPTEYTSAIEEAGRAGYDVLIIDSLSHAWAGEGGALELKDKAGQDFYGWRVVTPMHNRMIDAILQSPCHVLCTLRSKIEYVPEEFTDEHGKKRTKIVKKGMSPVQRPGMEYEFSVYASIDEAHIFKVTKSRIFAIQDAVMPKPGADFMRPVIDWLEQGADAPTVEIPKVVGQEQLVRLNELAMQLKLNPARVKSALTKYGVSDFKDLLVSQADEIEKAMREKVKPPASAALPSAQTLATDNSPEPNTQHDDSSTTPVPNEAKG